MFSRNFDGNGTFADLERTCMDIQKIKTANLVGIAGQVAQLPDGTQKNINVAQFDPQDDMSEVHDILKFIKKGDADVAFLNQMAQQGMTQIGDDMDVFIQGQTATEAILIFGKTTLVIHSIHN